MEQAGSIRHIAPAIIKVKARSDVATRLQLRQQRLSSLPTEEGRLSREVFCIQCPRHSITGIFSDIDRTELGRQLPLADCLWSTGLWTLELRKPSPPWFKVNSKQQTKHCSRSVSVFR
ncbi:hypothetical protein CaCOL14_009837 [Colletotrichum acutatum]